MNYILKGGFDESNPYTKNIIYLMHELDEPNPCNFFQYGGFDESSLYRK